MTAKEKNRLAGIFLMAHGGLQGLLMLVMMAIFVVLMIADPGAPTGLLFFISIFMAVWSAIFIGPQLWGGWKMYKEHPNAKNWGIAGAIMACMNAPLGTAAGVFALIFLFGEDGNSFYAGRNEPKYLDEADSIDEFQFNNNRQREPHSWK